MKPTLSYPNDDLEAASIVLRPSGAPSIILAQSPARSANRCPRLLETTNNATLPVTTSQAVDTVPQPVIAHGAGALVCFPCDRISDQINHTNSSIYE